MAIYEEPGISFYKSNDLLHWEFLSSLSGYFECPDILRMSVDGNSDIQKWILTDASGSYTIGEFDGTKFIPESEKHYLGEPVFYNKVGNRTNYYTKDIYATQTFKQSYEGDGPFYQLAFLMIKEPPTHKRTWSQQLIFPVELTLRTINGKLTLCRNPIDAIKQLRYSAKFWKNATVHPGENAFKEVQGDVLEIITELDLGKADEVIFDIRGEKLSYHVSSHQMIFMDSQVAIIPKENKIKLRLIVDRNSVEIYSNEGEVSVARLFYPDQSNKKFVLTSVGGVLTIMNMEVYNLQSIWLKKEQKLGYQREK